MVRQNAWVAMAIALCFTISIAHGEPKEKEGEKTPGREPQGQASTLHKSEGMQSGQATSGASAPGGDWSARTHSGKLPPSQTSNQPNGSAATGTAASSAVNKNQTPPASGAQGAAAGAAAANHNQPQYSAAQGAAAGAAVANHNQPQYSAAQGAAAGAAVANRNQPQYSGVEGAAVGAAVANNNNNQNQYSAVQGAAVGAALANSNQTQYPVIPGAAGVAASNNNQPPSSGATGTVGGTTTPDIGPPQGGGQPGTSGPPSATAGNMTAASDAVSAAAAGYQAVRNSFNASNVYRPQWWRDHPETWVPSGWAVGQAWQPASWANVAGFCEYGNVVPTSYNYGVNVTAQNGNVFVDGQNVGSTGDYSLQALNIAQAGAAVDVPATGQWLPLGVFAMVRDEHQHPQLIVQLAINKQGLLRGNYIDELTESTLPIRGAVDKATKRAAWLVGSNQQTVMEAGLSDLTDPETPALIHKNGKTEHWILVRLDRPN
jgi:hypothetical protein